jgi:hypothetical protein
LRTREQRDAILADIARETLEAEHFLQKVEVVEYITPEKIRAQLKPFYRWPLLPREQRRQVLAATRHQILCKEYQVTGIRLFGLDGLTPQDTDTIGAGTVRSGIGTNSLDRKDSCRSANSHLV